ncbi:MAG: transcription antiterminator [Alicyclobacillus sp.]|nr:transcription antiterminator [Alicyclobacillus sp.]
MRLGEAFTVERVLNNNVLIVRSDREGERILVGKGLGFGAKRGQQIRVDDERIEKRFVLDREENQAHFQQLFATVPPEVVGVAEEIISLASSTLQQSLHEHIHVALADHIGFALARLRGGLNIDNPFVDEIRTLYPAEWEVAAVGAKWVEERFGTPIPEEEIGFWTLHLHSATHARGLSETMRVTDAVNAAVKALEAQLGPLPRGQLNYARMVIHLRFAIQRILRDQPIVNPLADAVAQRLPRAYEMARQVADAISARIKRSVPDDEVSYLAMHIARFTS